MNFERAFSRLVDVRHEGGYVNNPHDPGGETKYGISRRTYPGEDITNLTLDRAREIYKRDYWGPAGCDVWHDILKYEMFDLAVNTSSPGHPVTAIKLFQQAVFALPDGIIGPETMMNAQSNDPQMTLRRLQALRLSYYTHLSDDWWHNFGKGVVNRVISNMLEA